MIFRIAISDDQQQIEFAQKIRALFANNKIKNTTYEPQNADIGVVAHQVINKKLLGQIVGLIQRSGYEITLIDNKNKEAKYVK
tara:strand:- start:7205 stop:7453 length:249 start_codon:yes stop_codon:yes gene_type:complete